VGSTFDFQNELTHHELAREAAGRLLREDAMRSSVRREVDPNNMVPRLTKDIGGPRGSLDFPSPMIAVHNVPFSRQENELRKLAAVGSQLKPGIQEFLAKNNLGLFHSTVVIRAPIYITDSGNENDLRIMQITLGVGDGVGNVKGQGSDETLFPGVRLNFLKKDASGHMVPDHFTKGVDNPVDVATEFNAYRKMAGGRVHERFIVANDITEGMQKSVINSVTDAINEGESLPSRFSHGIPPIGSIHAVIMKILAGDPKYRYSLFRNNCQHWANEMFDLFSGSNIEKKKNHIDEDFMKEMGSGIINKKFMEFTVDEYKSMRRDFFNNVMFGHSKEEDIGMSGEWESHVVDYSDAAVNGTINVEDHIYQELVHVVVHAGPDD
jgi:hypothetical protein